jgi:hypothetical protein
MGNLELHFFFKEFWLTIGNLELHFFTSKELTMLTMGNLELHFFFLEFGLTIFLNASGAVSLNAKIQSGVK